MLELNKIYCMDNVDGMKLLDDDCIDLTITSPPYDDIRSYNGFSWHPENLIKELYRITKSGGGGLFGELEIVRRIFLKV